jgi:hypothetical protein
MEPFDAPVTKVIVRSPPLHYSSVLKELEDMEIQAVEGNSLRVRSKNFNRRFTPDWSQRIRRVVQWLFVALNCWSEVQFFLWVRYFERGFCKRLPPRRILCIHRIAISI